MLKVVQDAEASNENTASSSLLDEIVRNGARQMLATALQAEVIAYVEAFADEVDEHGLSSSDFVPALEQFLGTGHGLSAATVTRLTKDWQAEATAFGQRDLSATDYV